MKPIVVALFVLTGCTAAAQDARPFTGKVPVFEPPQVEIRSENAFRPTISILASHAIPPAPGPVAAPSMRGISLQSSRPVEFKTFLSGKLNRSLIATEFSTRSLDAMSTYRKLHDPCRCYREASRLFGFNMTPVFESQAGAYSYSLGVAAAYSFISYELWNAGQHHPRHARLLQRLSRALLIGDSSIEMATDIHNLSLRHIHP